MRLYMNLSTEQFHCWSRVMLTDENDTIVFIADGYDDGECMMELDAWMQQNNVYIDEETGFIIAKMRFSGLIDFSLFREKVFRKKQFIKVSTDIHLEDYEEVLF